MIWEKQKEVLSSVLDRVNAGIPVAFLFVLESKGSSPGRTGFCMLADGQGELFGSIGGGMMEHKLVETARAFLEGKSPEITVFQQIHSKDSPRNQSGMICSGEQTVWIRKIDELDAQAISTFLTGLDTSETHFLEFGPGGISSSIIRNNGQSGFSFRTNTHWKFGLIAQQKERIFLAGGGHCALALSRLLDWLGFEIVIFETRPDLNTLSQNTWVKEIRILNDYSEISASLPDSEEVILIAMTFGYRTDDQVIRSVKDKKFRFLGLLGSKAKIQQMIDTYHHESWDPDWLSQIKAPVGLPILSQTPEEIAVSIAAQLIREFRLASH